MSTTVTRQKDNFFILVCTAQVMNHSEKGEQFLLAYIFKHSRIANACTADNSDETQDNHSLGIDDFL